MLTTLVAELNGWAANHTAPYTYYQFHYALSDLAKADPTFRASWDRVPPVYTTPLLA